jgi:hypothetical protein
MGDYMSYMPLTALNIPSKNSLNNIVESDVIGNKTDDEIGDSIYSKLYIIGKHLHSKSKVYPTLASAKTINKVNTTSWGLDASTVEIIPANTITEIFDIHYINIGSISANDEYEILLFEGTVGNEVEIARGSFDRTVTVSEGSLPIQTDLIPANTRISAKLTSLGANARNISVKLHYHEY